MGEPRADSAVEASPSSVAAQSPHIPVTRSKVWQLKTRRLEFGPLPSLMGILNVTPDSFSDGGRYFNPSQAVERALRMEDDGADIIDVGGESTRPYSESVSEEEELQRVVPVIDALQGKLQIPISVDTSKVNVARAAIDLGAEIVNDITGLTGDPAMPELVAESRVGVCAMHMQGTPQTMQDKPNYEDVVGEILQYLAERDAELIAAGVSPQSLCLDPGIGFGKTHEHNLNLVRSAAAFHELGRPILIGHSRKGFVGKILRGAADRDHGTLGISLALAQAQVQILRVHEIRATKHALLGFAAAGGLPMP